MNIPTPPQLTQVPSARKLLLSTAAAVVVAMVLLATTILPAEYGIDPLGTGKILGLTAISAPLVEAEPAAPAGAPTLTPTQDGPVAHFSAEYKVDTIQLVLDPYQYVEYKYRLEKGATMLYAWTATSPPIYDFHADPDGEPKPDPVSFDKKSKPRASGAFTAPFAGIHGWYWENPGGEPLTITLTTAGFYSTATEFRSPRVRRSHELTALERLVFPSRPGAGSTTP
jgi:hypothetical protein